MYTSLCSYMGLTDTKITVTDSLLIRKVSLLVSDLNGEEVHIYVL